MMEITKKELRILIGSNIRKERTARKLSIDELAELLGQTSGYIGLIERGERGVTYSNLHKLSLIFGLPIDRLFQQDNTSAFGEPHGLRDRLSSLISDFGDDELGFIILIVKGMRQMGFIRK